MRALTADELELVSGGNPSDNDKHESLWSWISDFFGWDGSNDEPEQLTGYDVDISGEVEHNIELNNMSYDADTTWHLQTNISGTATISVDFGLGAIELGTVRVEPHTDK